LEKSFYIILRSFKLWPCVNAITSFSWDDMDMEWMYFNVLGEDLSLIMDHAYDTNKYPD
jgi:hypothetical protein